MSACLSIMARTNVASLLARPVRLSLARRGTKVVFVGEHHAQSGVIAAQASTLRAYAGELIEASASDGNERGLHVVFEHFSVTQTALLESFVKRRITFEELWDSYQATGQEGFHLPTYRPVFDALQEAAARDSRFSVHGFGGFIPRQRAREFVGHPPQTVDAAAAGASSASPLHRVIADGMLLPAALTVTVSDLPRLPGLAPGEAESAAAASDAVAPATCDGYGKLSACIAASAAHRSFFFSLLSGAELPRTAAAAEEVYSSAIGAAAAASSLAGGSAAVAAAARSPLHPENPSRILPAQAIKDMVAACAVYKALAALPPAGGTVIVLCGKGHCDYGFGIPERLLALLAAAPMTGKSTADAASSSPSSYVADGAGGGAGAASDSSSESADAKSDADAGGELLIMTCCEENEAEAATQPAYFPDGKMRCVAHAIMPFTPDPEDDDDDDDSGGATEGKT